MRLVTRIVLLAVLVAPSLAAQRPAGGRRGQPQQQQQPVPDSTPAQRAAARQPADTNTKRRTPDGFVLDFQDQDLRLVLSAIAEAGSLNVTLANIPQRRVTLRMGQPTSREQTIEVLRGVAESNGLRMIEGASLIRIEGQVQLTNLQQAQLQAQSQQFRLFTYRLKHASAVQLAPVLMNLFTGIAGGNNFAGVQGFGGGGPGVQIFNPAGAAQGNQPTTVGNAAATAAAQAAAQRAAQGGGQPGGAPGAQGGGPAGIGQALQQAFQQAFTGNALSSSAGQIRIVAEEATNSLLVRATAEDWQLVQQVLGAVDLRPLQVLIEVTIAEVQRNHDLNVGLSGAVTNSNTGRPAADTNALLPSAASARDFILQLTGGKGGINYNVALNALQTRGDVRILSLPVVIAQNNRQAILNVGSKVPFVQIQQTSGIDPSGRTSTVQYLDVGTTLTITPTINPDGYINLQVKQTNNSVTNEVQFSAPIINEREATTQIFIKNGQTTVIGGLAGNTTNNTTSGIPFLSRLPLIGWIFGNTTKSNQVSELFLFLTPHIISSDEDVDKLREAVKNGSELLTDVQVGPRFSPAVDSARMRVDSVHRADSVRARADSIVLRQQQQARPAGRRPPAAPRDSTPPAGGTTPPDTPPAVREERSIR